MDKTALPYKLSALLLGIIIAVMAAPEESAGSSNNAFLEIGPNPRAAAMGDAFTGIADDVTSLYWNPAGLGMLKAPQALMLHNQWLQDIRYEYLAAGLPLSLGALAVSATYVTYGGLAGTDENANPTGAFDAYDFSLSAGYGVQLAPGIQAGAVLKYPVSVIDGEARHSFSGDIGLLYRPAFLSIFQMGLDAVNLSTLGEGNQPAQVKLGFGLLEPIAGLNAGCDFSKRVADEALQINTGLEYWIGGVFALRAGYRFTSADNGLGTAVAGLTAGAGFRQHLGILDFSLDYAYTPYGDLGSAHRISLWLSLVPAKTAEPAVSTPEKNEKKPAATIRKKRK